MIPSEADAALDALLRTAPWMPEDARAAVRYERVDHAVLDRAALLLIVAAVGGPASGQRFFVPVRTDGTGRLEEAHGTDAFDIAAVTRTLAGGRLPTVRGGTVEFRGAGHRPTSVRRLPFDRGWSSNALSLVDVAGTWCVHKTYRRLDQAIHEPELLRRMNGTGRTPRWIGDYAYTDPSGTARHPLGVVYGYVRGEGIDLPLRENLRSMWPRAARAGAPPADQLARSHLRPLEGALRKAGEFLRGFHQDLERQLGGTAAGYPVREALADATARVGALDRRAGELSLPKAAHAAAFAALRDTLHALESGFGGGAAVPSGPCHGDLHLSHLLCAAGTGADTGWRMTVIDLSTPALSPDDPRWAEQSPLQDLVAIERALEYFAADEAAFESARRLGVDSLETMLGALAGAPHWSRTRQAVLRQVFGAADAWRERVLRLLLGTASGHPLHRLLYLRRLLHELGYNQAHARPYHAAIDLRHARALVPTAAFARK
ncbi:phosphotransferase [Streptomyces hygroscopicus subsp. hygroscopicus]|uniref:phosphotransferase n=1 Tax=Streptomyces hygroscopicus TaxID=1912 RepID=UPI0007DB5C7A|nr:MULTISPECIES: phosphotransferase [Streptomyces]MBW8087257.1 phosphotransferase [Streptomyces hygroscopicus subsp. hygroscopicus]